MGYIIKNLLRVISRLIIKKYSPIIIGVTGSVGKTSVKEYLYHFLKDTRNVCVSFGNYNNEFGLPRTIISPRSHKFGLFGDFFRCFLFLVFPLPYPSYLILEYGSDKPGDIKYLCNIVKPFLSIITAITDAHSAAYKNKNALFDEKMTLAKMTDRNGAVIFGVDHIDYKEIDIPNQIYTYGRLDGSDVRLIGFDYDFDPFSTTVKIDYKGNTIPFRVRQLLSSGQVYSLLGAICAARVCDVPLLDIIRKAEHLSVMHGRGNILPSIKNGYIIDETYNASTESTISALTLLDATTHVNKVLILGDLFELSDDAIKNAITKISDFLIKSSINYIFLVGEKIRPVYDILKKDKYNNMLEWYATTDECMKKLPWKYPERAFCLVKGSRAAHMEKIVHIIKESF